MGPRRTKWEVYGSRCRLISDGRREQPMGKATNPEPTSTVRGNNEAGCFIPDA